MEALEKAVKSAIRSLKQNRDIEITTKEELVVTYICNRIRSQTGVPDWIINEMAKIEQGRRRGLKKLQQARKAKAPTVKKPKR